MAWSRFFIGNGKVARIFSASVRLPPVSESDRSTGTRLCKLAFRSLPLASMIRCVTSLNSPSAVSALVMFARRSASTLNAGWICSMAAATTSRCSASWPPRRSRPLIAAIMSPVWRSRFVVSSFSCGSRSRIASSRPVSAELSSRVMVSSCATPPPLSTTDSEDSTCSVVG